MRAARSVSAEWRSTAVPIADPLFSMTQKDRAKALVAPRAGHVHGLMKRADVHGAVAEVADGDALALFVAQRIRGARREREVTADDAVAAVEAMLDVEEMHRAALPLREAGGLAEQLRHDLAGIGAEDEGVR